MVLLAGGVLQLLLRTDKMSNSISLSAGKWKELNKRLIPEPSVRIFVRPLRPVYRLLSADCSKS